VFRRQLSRCPIDGFELTYAPSDPLVGTEIAARYLLEGVVGDTSSNRIYRALDRETGAPVALRLLFGEYAMASRRCLAFVREAHIARRFAHANVLGVLDAGYLAAGVPFLVTEPVEARTLEGLIHAEAPFAIERVIRLTRELCAGLGHVHDAGVVHRNLSGNNVLIDDQGSREVVRITGFGHALGPPEALEEEGLGGSRAGAPAAAGGKAPAASPAKGSPAIGIGQPLEPPRGSQARPPYISPEQALGLPLDHRSDLFSLGVLIHRMVCGAFPFGRPTHGVPRGRERALENIALILLSQEPSERFQSAAEVQRALAGL
jgi:serine/threonine-protein kinase